jgi:hypothetical protein
VGLQILVTSESGWQKDFLVKFFRSISFVKKIEFVENNQEEIPDSKFTSATDFEKGFGLGKSKKTTLQELRSKAWKR